MVPLRFFFDFSLAEDIADAVALANGGDSKNNTTNAGGGGWRMADGSIIGSYSKATLQSIQTRQDYHRLVGVEDGIFAITIITTTAGTSQSQTTMTTIYIQ